MKGLLYRLSVAERDKETWVVIGSVVAFILLRIPSLIEPYWYGDEGVYEVIGMALRQGRLLYAGIWDNKPPLLYVIYALVNSNQESVKFLSLLAGVCSLISFFLLTRLIFKSFVQKVISLVLFTVLLGSPLLEGNIANAEPFMLFPILLAAILLFTSGRLRFGSKKPYIASGLLLSAAFLLKVVAVFDFLSFFLFLFLVAFFDINFSDLFHIEKMIQTLKSKKNTIVSELVLFIFFLIPISAAALFFLFQGTVSDFIAAIFSQNVDYVGYDNFLLIPMGLVLVKVFFLITGILAISFYRKKIGISGVFILTWFVLSLFSVFISGRPYTHYLLVLLPSFCLLISFLYRNKRFLLVKTIFLGVVVTGILWNIPLYGKTIPYYENFIAFVTGQESIESYQAFFDSKTPRDYAIANFITTQTTGRDQIFLWGDSPQIYVLSGKLPPGRFLAAYHVIFYDGGVSETIHVLQKTQPKLIIATQDVHPIFQVLQSYSLQFRLDGADVYERKT